MVHIDGRLLKFMCAIKSLDVFPYDIYILIVLKAKDVRSKEIVENRSNPFTGRSTFVKTCVLNEILRELISLV